MRLCRDLPEVKKSMEEGKLNIVNAAQLQSFFNLEKKAGVQRSPEDKKVVVGQVLGLSQKECQKRLASLSPEAVLPKENEKPLSAEKTQLRLILDRDAMTVLSELKGLLAHCVPSGTYSDLVHYMAKDVLKRIERKRSGKQRGFEVVKQKVMDEVLSVKQIQVSPQNRVGEQSRVNEDSQVNLPMLVNYKTESIYTTTVAVEKVRTIEEPFHKALMVGQQRFLPKKGHRKIAPRKTVPAVIRQNTWRRSGGRCEYMSSDGRRYASRFSFELDHITPLAQLGRDDAQNFRYTCRSHNQYLAIVTLGKNVMMKHYSWLD